MIHLLICREFPPAAYPPGGIGTYLRHISRALAEAGETVHVIAHRWRGAPQRCETLCDGRLIVHRVSLDDGGDGYESGRATREEARALLRSSFPAQAFSWQAALVAERLIEREGVEVIEAQEWEAPLYYLQLRRAMGLGPSQKPPCIVHLHSPSERIFAANEWDLSVADYAPAASMERYSILQADAILAPSRFVAEEARRRYGLDPGRMTIIPYPIGVSARLDRDDSVWANGSICHVGRLELRKGVVELVDALNLLGAAAASVRVDFVGGDTPRRVTGGATVGAMLRRRATPDTRRRLRFHGSLDRVGVLERLSKAWCTVVPSRWENFPYSCMEAMASGLPVIASSNGGVPEMVEDGVSGWVAEEGSSSALAEALRRGLDTPPGRRRTMGAAAADRIRQLCDNSTVVARHLAFKRELAGRAATRARPDAVTAHDTLGIIVRTHGSAAEVLPMLERLAQDGGARITGRLVGDELDGRTLLTARSLGWATMPAVERAGRAELVAARELCRGDAAPASLVFLDGSVKIDDRLLDAARGAFAANPRLAVLTTWVRDAGAPDRILVPEDPAVAHLLRGTIAPCVIVRTRALRDADGTPADLDSKAPLAAALTRVIEAGWEAAVYPAPLVTARTAGLARGGNRPVRYSSMARAVQRLHMPLVAWFLGCSPPDRRVVVVEALHRPALALRWLAARLARALRPPVAARHAASR